MEVTLIQYLIVCPLVGLAGFVDAVAGGGGLISLPAYLIAGLPVHFAIGTNKLSAGLGTGLTTWRYSKNGYIKWRLALTCVVTALIGSSLGANLALLLSDRVFKIIMLFILPATALYITKNKAMDQQKEPFDTKKTVAISMAVAMVIGAYDGFYGPGTGTFLILLLNGLAHLSLQEANGVSKVINLTTNLTALVVFLMNGKVLIMLGLVAAIFSLIGSYLGTVFFDKMGSRSVKPIMLVVVSIFFVRVCLELAGVI